MLHSSRRVEVANLVGCYEIADVRSAEHLSVAVAAETRRHTSSIVAPRRSFAASNF